MLDPTKNFGKRLNKNPHLFWPALFSWLRGWWYRIKFTLLGKRFRAGKLFRVYGPLNVTGPGRVEFGKNCLIISNAIKPVCIRTLAPEAQVKLGDHAGLNGTSIQCVRQVEIGELSNIADAYITDTAAHTLGPQRRMEGVEDLPAHPVLIGRNVWISVSVVILDGVRIGDNSVLGACSLVREDVPANVFAAGSPLRIIRHLE
jgi:acetyltransferase-like isoleucine patch superfamily enzyme